jgi:hypothetical protein
MYETFYWLQERRQERQNSSIIPERVLRQFDLPIYEAAIAGAKVL